MTWLRKDGHYYRSERDGERVRSVHVGKGLMAEIFLQLDAERHAEEAAWRQERAEMDAEDATMAAFAHDVTTLARAAMYAAGGYRHHKGDWRKRREESEGASANRRDKC